MAETSADCYVTLAFANAFLSPFARVEWASAQDAAKIAVLEEATVTIDGLKLDGVKCDTYVEHGAPRQVREFPRVIDGIYCDYDDSTRLPCVPLAVKQAVCWEALGTIKWGDSPRLEWQRTGVQQIQIGGGSTGLTESYVSGAGKGLLSIEAKRLMARYVVRGGSIT